MNKLLTALIAATFALGSAFGFAADAGKKKEELTAEQKIEIRDRVARLKTERTQAEQTKAAPGKMMDKKAPAKN